MRSVRTILLVLATLAVTVLGGASAPARAAPILTIFGDSYSIPVHDGTRDWPLLLRDAGIVGRINDFAKFGATASSGWHINFAQGTAARLGVRGRSGYLRARFPGEVETTWSGS